MKYLVLFVCSMIIPAMNTSAVSIALSNNIVDLIFYIIDFGVFGWGIQRLKEKDEHPIGIILAVTAIEDLIINYICLFDYLFISSQMSAKPYFIGSTGILLLW